ncbi:hypothetical protein POM88_033678 [Heracleum sosnowskyi]|uniref:Protein kinase domain-containing protein n=1 Tax=Heracleum sosnowskyi TaxID=360622 RepID=A0AAD8HJ81_9APIA|nr:hypothetical protein POM88_033678 [Heracleum sosnowskyi]
MEWIDGIRCTNPQAIKDAGLDIDIFFTIGVSSALRQLLEFGLFHGDPHPGNIFAMRDGRITYVDFGNVAQLSQWTDVTPIVPVLESIWQNSSGKGLSGFNFGSVTGSFSSNRMQFSDV